jgi:hypothetical protein
MMDEELPPPMFGYVASVHTGGIKGMMRYPSGPAQDPSDKRIWSWTIDKDQMIMVVALEPKALKAKTLPANPA